MAQSAERVVRVFISSTFRDMQAEREELVKKIFPQLQELCKKRNVIWSEVDLRWGITDEQKAEGKVLPICLEEIERCRPYFICLLGERYGWIPQIPHELINIQPWLKENLERSVTELEILHGVLNNPDMAKRAHFYFRDPKFVDTLPKEKRSEYREVPTLQEIEEFGETQAKHRAAERKNKLRALKKHIRSSGMPVHEDYRDPEEAGQLILADFTELINRLFPEYLVLDAHEQERIDHEKFAASFSNIYLPRQEYFARLDAHITNRDPPLVITGDLGAGKSALLANWVLKHRKEHPDDLIIIHFVGATSHSTDTIELFKRIMGEIKRKFSIRGEMPTESYKIMQRLKNWFYKIAPTDYVILAIDAIDQLGLREVLQLVWLSEKLPPNIRVVFSASAGEAFDELANRGWPLLEVDQPFSNIERLEFIKSFLEQYSKSLEKRHLDRIISIKQTGNPLYLKTVLEELRIYGNHEKLSDMIQYYIKDQNIEILYGKILQRYEEDYEKDRSYLVRDSLTLLLAARRGLSEPELLSLLGSNGKPMPYVYWSWLRLAAGQLLIERRGMIGFVNESIRIAVGRRYLITTEVLNETRLKIAKYFGFQASDRRSVEESPWQLMQAKEWSQQKVVLQDFEFAGAIAALSSYDLLQYWSALVQATKSDLKSAYSQVIANPEKYQKQIDWVICLLERTGNGGSLISLLQRQVQLLRSNGQESELQKYLEMLAMALFKDSPQTQFHSAHVSFEYLQRNDWFRLLDESQAISRKTGNLEALQQCLGDKALIFLAGFWIGEAVTLLEDQESICRQIGSAEGLQRCLGNQARLDMAIENREMAMKRLKEQEKLCKITGNIEGLIICMLNQSDLLRKQHQEFLAIKIIQDQLKLSKSLRLKEIIKICLLKFAEVCYDMGACSAAIKAYGECAEICKEIGDETSLHWCLKQQNLISSRKQDN